MLETAALAQHYGLPTRLLDWSYDPFIAAFFAANGVKNDEGNLSIWCFNAEYFSTFSAMNKNFPLKIITPPYADNENLSSQKGIFTHVSTTFKFNYNEVNNINVNRTPLDTLLSNTLPEIIKDKCIAFYKITFPCSEVNNLLSRLVIHGYGVARIYPGYKGIANQVMTSYKK